MNLQRTLFFLDFANVNRAANELNNNVDYLQLKEYMGFGRELLDSYCYVPIDPRNEHKTDRAIEELQKAGYLVTTKVGTYAGDSYKCDFDVEMTMDLIKMAHVIRPEIIVVGTGDSDFIPVVVELRRMGIRVEIAAFNSSMSKKLRLNASGFIDLDQYILEIDEEEIVDEPNDEDVPFLENKVEENYQDEIPLSLTREQIEIASEILDDEKLESYIFPDSPEFSISRDSEEIRQNGKNIVQEFQSELGSFIIYRNN